MALVHGLCKLKPDWLPSCPDVLQALVQIWSSQERLAAEEQAAMPLEQVREFKVIAKCFVSCLRHQAKALGDEIGDGHIELLFLMLSIFSHHTLVAYDFLKLFYLEEVATGYSVAQRVACLRYFLRFFQSSRTAREDRVQALQLIALPMLCASFAKGEGEASGPRDCRRLAPFASVTIHV